MNTPSSYPACFFNEADGITVVFPDLNWLSTCGRTLDDARWLAVDCLSGYLQWLEEDGDLIPEPSRLEDVDLAAIAAELEGTAENARVEMVTRISVDELRQQELSIKFESKPLESRSAPAGSYIIVAGAHGVGKSSFAGALGYDPAAIHETTLAGPELAAEVRQAKADGLAIRMHYIALTDVSEALQRVRSRVEHGGHETAPECVQRSFARRWGALARVLPYCDTVTFFDNDNGFVKVAEYRGGTITTMTENSPKWLREMLDCLDGRRLP